MGCINTLVYRDPVRRFKRPYHATEGEQDSPRGKWPRPQKEELESGQLTMGDVYRILVERFDKQLETMDSRFDRMDSYSDRLDKRIDEISEEMRKMN